SENDYANIVACFSFTYAIGYLLAGRALDRLGVKVGYALVVGLWALAVAGHGLVRSVLGFQIMRGAMGLPAGGTFPAAVKAVGEWFPKRERALATGLFNAGSNVGVIVAPLLVPRLVEHFGWPSAFFLTAILGLVWLIAWQRTYEAPD